jgi:hypothetical protein
VPVFHTPTLAGSPAYLVVKQIAVFSAPQEGSFCLLMGKIY